MARPRGPNEPSTYEPQPEVPPELTRRFDLVRAVLGQRLSITEAAQQLGIARNNMQSLVHRVETAIVTALQPRPAGKAPKPAHEKELEARVKKLEAENKKLHGQLLAMDEMLGAAGEIIRALRGMPPTSSSRVSSRTSRGSGSRKKPTSEDPEPASPIPIRALRSLAQIATTPELAGRAARVLGISITTFRRWLGRLALGDAIQHHRGGRRAAVTPATEHAVRIHVRQLAGLAGAASLARSVSGVSRRIAAEIKRDELTAMERERQAGCLRVGVAHPGVLRGFDAMHLDGGFALAVCDAAVPYRTSIGRVPNYTSPAVARVLDLDFERHGAPLVVRLDRAKCHDAEPVLSVLRSHRVIALHGPPRYPRYYGQLERQNREHRAWERCYGLDDLDAMMTALNALWRRPTLDWRTAEEVWANRPILDENRDDLRDEVEQRTARLRTDGVAEDLATRLAIEQALIKRSYLTITPARPALRE
jgi:transposase